MKKLKLLLAAFVFMASLGVVLSITSGEAFAAAKTWTGGGSDNNFSTAANWSPSGAPQDGDSLILPADAGLTFQEGNITNDIDELSLSGITVNGECNNLEYLYYTIVGSELTITGDVNVVFNEVGSCSTNLYLNLDVIVAATINIAVDGTAGTGFQLGSFNGSEAVSLGSSNLNITTSSGSTRIYSDVTGSGNITASGYLTMQGVNTGYSGQVSITNGTLYIKESSSLGSSSATIGEGASLNLGNITQTSTIETPITFSGNGAGGSLQKLLYETQGCMAGISITLSGLITVNNSFVLNTSCDIAVVITNAILNGNSITMQAGSNGSLTVNGQQEEAAYADIVIDQDSTANANYVVSDKIRMIVKAQVPNTTFTVRAGGILMGTGTVGEITVETGGVVAPGLSPGCLTSANVSFVEGSTYDVEVGGPTACSEYDQLKVTGTVILGSATLRTAFWNSFKPTAGQSYMIIDNDGTDAVDGTFKDLPEGATFTVDGVVFRINYTGGDGNDVVLTVVSIPAAPDTGFGLLKTYPIVTFVTTSVLAGGIYVLAHKQKLFTK